MRVRYKYLNASSIFKSAVLHSSFFFVFQRELYAVLKSREYETLLNDMGFLYDRQTSETGDSQAPLQDVVRTHGIRDNFEYLCATKDNFPKVLFSFFLYL